MTPPTPQELRAVRVRLGISRAEFAARLNTSLRTLDGWEIQGRRPPGCLRLALRYLEDHIGELPDA